MEKLATEREVATRKYKINKIFLSFLCLFVAKFPSSAIAQDSPYIIATNFSATGKVLELDMPLEVDGMRISIAVENSQSQGSINLVVARAGKHCYETRHIPEWHGIMKYVAMTPLRGAVGRLKEPTFADNVDMFLEPERITPATSNLLIQHRIFARSWTMCLFVIFFVSAIFFRVFLKKPTMSALVLGFLVAWVLLDLRIMFDHAIIFYSEERFHKGMPPLTDIKLFSDRAAGIIGRSTWGHGSLDGYEKFLEYRLAEHPYAISGSDRQPVFWVTQDPAEGSIIIQHGKYYLVKKDKP